MKVDVTKRHACQAKRKSMSPTQERHQPATKKTVDVTKCHACHAKCHGRLPREKEVNATQCHACQVL